LIPASMARIVRAEDHEIFRGRLNPLLKTVLGLKVPAETGDSLDALDPVETHAPDVRASQSVAAVTAPVRDCFLP